jgi:predicted phosphodiesterase
VSTKISQEGIWVWAFDVHSPHVHWPTFNALIDFTQRQASNIVGFGFGGDQNDNGEISHHNKKRIKLRIPGSYRRNTLFFDNKVLSPIESALDKKAQRIWIEGNHDDWENQAVDEQPEFEGTLERRGLLNLDARKWKFIPTGQAYELGKLLVIHGETLTGLGNQGSNYHAKKAVESYGRSVLYGHIHSPQSFTRVAPYNRTDRYMAWCSPIIGSLNPHYLRNRPTAWMNGFTIVEVRANGDFNVSPIIVTRGKFSYGGKVYGA